jgi:hypothetical protein
MSEASPQVNAQFSSRSDHPGGDGNFSSIAFTMSNVSRTNTIVQSDRSIENEPAPVEVRVRESRPAEGRGDSSTGNNLLLLYLPDSSIASDSTAFV